MDFSIIEVTVLYLAGLIAVASSSVYFWYKRRTTGALLVMIGLWFLAVGSLLSTSITPSTIDVSADGQVSAIFDLGVSWQIGRHLAWLGPFIATVGFWIHASKPSASA